MELKKDCVRDVLLYLEKNLNYNEEVFANNIGLKKYSKEDIYYTCEKLSEAGFLNVKIDKFIMSETPLIMIKSITYDGHQFLDNIRDPKVWRETKTKLKEIGGVSLNIISQVAAAVISQKLGL